MLAGAAQGIFAFHLCLSAARPITKPTGARCIGGFTSPADTAISRPDELRSVPRLGALRVVIQIASAPTASAAFRRECGGGARITQPPGEAMKVVKE